MRVRFVGDPRHDGEGPEAVEAFGLSFVKGVWRDAPASLAAKVKGHSHFEIDSDGDGEPGPTLEEVRARLTERGLKFHHKAGIPRLLEILAEADGDLS